MTRTHANLTTLLSVLAAALFGGCQKTMGTAANGPFAPAGTLAPATSQPLIPFGPLTGATRVPPPPTGSTQAGNSYAGPMAMSANAPMGSADAYDSFASTDTNPHSAPPNMSANALSANARSNLGGMPIIDLTAGMNAAQNMPAAYSNQAVGSGIASNQTPPNGWQNSSGQPAFWQSGLTQTGAYQPAPSISVAPSDLAARLRPLDANLSATAIPLPGQHGSAPPVDNSFGQTSPAWQSVQPASAISVVQNQPYVSQLPNGPSTEPIGQSSEQTGQSQSNSLLWRNPAVAR